MYAGTQYLGTSKVEMEFLVRHGVTHFDATVDNMELETLTRHKEEAAAHGVELEMVHIKPMDSIPMARDPQRQKDIDTFCQYIENASQAGLRGLNYNFCVLRAPSGGLVQRTRRRTGRGGSTYSSFELSEYDNETLTEAGRVNRNEVFDRAAYFLERVIPVAESYQIQMACHLNDPSAPVLRGVGRWNWPVFEGLKRFSELVDSPYHGFNFCCGVAAEGLEDPATELPPIVKYFAEHKKLFNVHFRNFKIQNLVASTDVGSLLMLDEMASAFGACCSYEPDMFPGLMLRIVDPKVVYLCFRSGKIVITGARDRDMIVSTFTAVYRDIMRQFIDQKLDSEGVEETE